MKPKFLGKNNKSQNKGGKNLLDIIDRVSLDIKYGLDIWNVYDFMYLDNNKIPSLSVLEISIPASSKFLIESKSMKLYLNHFYNKSYKSKNEIIRKIRKDIESKIKTRIKVKFIDTFIKEPKYIYLNNFKLKKTPINKVIKFNGFRSICPVTSQPDFANIYIYSNESFDSLWLKKYLISFSDHGGFHEQCIELIFKELIKKYKIKHLEICGRFQRRGGIDINPIRGTHQKKMFINFREFNQ